MNQPISKESSPDKLIQFAAFLRRRSMRWRLLRQGIEAIENRDPLVYQFTAVLFVILAIAFSIAPIMNSSMELSMISFSKTYIPSS